MQPPERLWGQAFWVKNHTTKVKHSIDLGNLPRGDKNTEAAEVEREWSILQNAPHWSGAAAARADRCAAGGADGRPARPQPPWLRIQSAVPKKLSASRWASTGSTDCSAIACTMQPSHWSRSAMPMAYGRWRARSRGWPKRSV